jgi:hypothetical protein
VAGGELLIPTIVLLYGIDIKTAGSLSLLVSLPTMLVAFARYSRDSSFAVLRANLRFVMVMIGGSITGRRGWRAVVGRDPGPGPAPDPGRGAGDLGDQTRPPRLGRAVRRACAPHSPGRPARARGAAAGDHGQLQPGHGAGRGPVRLSRASSVRPLAPGAKLFHTNEINTLYPAD